MMRPMQERQWHRLGVKAKLDPPTVAFLWLVRNIKPTTKIMDSEVTMFAILAT
jgi:hypothetical protein